MVNDDWIHGPFGPEVAKGWSTLTGQRTVLAVVHHPAAATRLVADILPLVECDRRVHVVYTVPPASAFHQGVADSLRRLGVLVMPWAQAIHSRFDLAVAAGHGMLERLHAPVITAPHGAGPGKFQSRVNGHGPPAARPISGLMRERLVVRGRVVPASLVVAHEWNLRLLKEECPEALPAAVVGGDPCLDRMLVSVPYRDAYRRALGVTPGQRLIFVSSTWHQASLFGRHPDLLSQLAAELPRERYRIVAALHPNVWGYYGPKAVASWHADCLERGVQLLRPEEGWRAAVIAADRVLGDHGSATAYALAMGVPALLAAFPEDSIVPGSHLARLAAVAPRLECDAPLQPQLDRAIHAYRADTYAAFRAMLSSRPGGSARILRAEMYRLMLLPEPQYPPRVTPVPLPRPIRYGDGTAA